MKQGGITLRSLNSSLSRIYFAPAATLMVLHLDSILEPSSPNYTQQFGIDKLTQLKELRNREQYIAYSWHSAEESVSWLKTK